MKAILRPVLRPVFRNPPPSTGGFTGILDSLSTAPVAAYSVARRLTADYEGALIRLRRGSDNEESDFGFDGDGLLDSAAVATWLSAATGYFCKLYDQIGSQDFSQATAGNQPQYEAAVAAINDMPNLNHAGWGNRFSAALASNWSGNPDHCLVAVGNYKIIHGGLRDFFDVGNSSYNTSIGAFEDSGTIRWFWANGANAFGTSAGQYGGTADQNYHYFVKRHASGTSTFRLDGGEIGNCSKTYSLTGTTAVWIGNAAGSITNENARFAEAFVFASDISSDDQTAIESDLASFYDL